MRRYEQDQRGQIHSILRGVAERGEGIDSDSFSQAEGFRTYSRASRGDRLLAKAIAKYSVEKEIHGFVPPRSLRGKATFV